MSYSPLYNQNTIWVAEYKDGSILREWDEDGKVHAFKEINKAELAKFHLISEKFDYFFDCSTGVFNVNGREFVFPLAGLPLNYAEGLIQFKDASTEFVPEFLKTSDYDGFEITSYNFGWKVTYGNVKSQVIFSLPEHAFKIEMTVDGKTIIWVMKL